MSITRALMIGNILVVYFIQSINLDPWKFLDYVKILCEVDTFPSTVEELLEWLDRLSITCEFYAVIRIFWLLWKLCNSDTLELIKSVLIIKVFWFSKSAYTLKGSLWDLSGLFRCPHFLWVGTRGQRGLIPQAF